MRIDIWTILLIGVGLLWIIGVDSMPVLKVLGFPMCLCAFALWVNRSSLWSKLSRFMEDGLNGKYD